MVELLEWSFNVTCSVIFLFNDYWGGKIVSFDLLSFLLDSIQTFKAINVLNDRFFCRCFKETQMLKRYLSRMNEVVFSWAWVLIIIRQHLHISFNLDLFIFSSSCFPFNQVYGVEGRYASALYSAASKQKSLDAVEKDLKTFGEALKKDDRWHLFCHSKVNL